MGIAASMCIKYACTPKQLLLNDHIHELQQIILKNDGYIPGISNTDPNDLVRFAKISATSSKANGKPENIANGISRKIADKSNAWISNGIGNNSETLSVDFQKQVFPSEIQLTFWSDFKYPIRITMSPNRQKQQRPGVAKELVKDYKIVFCNNGKIVKQIDIKNNHQRRNNIKFDKICCDSINIIISNTNGHKDAVIFEVRAYQ